MDNEKSYYEIAFKKIIDELETGLLNESTEETEVMDDFMLGRSMGQDELSRELLLKMYRIYMEGTW